MGDVVYKPLTPELRGKINNSIDANLAELSTCNSNAVVNCQIAAQNALKNIIRALPDGYLIPFTKN